MKKAGVGERAPADHGLPRDVDAREAEAGQRADRDQVGELAVPCVTQCSQVARSSRQRVEHEQRRSPTASATITSSASRCGTRGPLGGASRVLAEPLRPVGASAGQRRSRAPSGVRSASATGAARECLASSSAETIIVMSRAGAARPVVAGGDDDASGSAHAVLGVQRVLVVGVVPAPRRRQLRRCRRPSSPSPTANSTAVMLSSPPRSFAALISACVGGVEVDAVALEDRRRSSRRRPSS